MGGEDRGIRHRLERKRSTLRVVIEVPLGELLAHLGPENTAYRARLAETMQVIAKDVLEVGATIAAEPETGVVKWFSESKGYGFIRGRDQQDVFVHYRGIAGDGFKNLQSGQRVQFKRRMGRETFEAIEVSPLPEEPV